MCSPVVSCRRPKPVWFAPHFAHGVSGRTTFWYADICRDFLLASIRYQEFPQYKDCLKEKTPKLKKRDFFYGWVTCSRGKPTKSSIDQNLILDGSLTWPCHSAKHTAVGKSFKNLHFPSTPDFAWEIFKIFTEQLLGPMVSDEEGWYRVFAEHSRFLGFN